MILELQNGGIVNITDDTTCHKGCDTCDYGSEYINEMNIELTKHEIHVEVKDMYNYLLSIGDVIKILANVDKTMTEEQFHEWLKEKLMELAKDSCYKIEEAFIYTVTG